MIAPSYLNHYIKWLETFECVSDSISHNNLYKYPTLSNVLIEIHSSYFSQFFESFPENFLKDEKEYLEYCLEKVYSFASIILKISMRKNIDINKILGDRDEFESVKFLKLILICAVSGPNNSPFIQKILGLDEIIQLTLMKSIESFQYGKQTLDNVSSDSITFKELLDKYEKLASINNDLSQELHEKNLRLSLLEAQRLHNTSESVKVCSHSRVEEKKTLVEETLELNNLKKKIDDLRKINNQIEALNEELKIKYEEEFNANSRLNEKVEELNKYVELSHKQADELDILREEILVLNKKTESLDQWRKKAEENSNLKIEISRLQSDNRLCLDKISELEQSQRITRTIKDVNESRKISVSNFEASSLSEIEDLKRKLFQENNRVFCLQSEKESIENDYYRIVGEYQKLRSLCENLCSSTHDFDIKQALEPIQIEIAKKPHPMTMCISVDNLNDGTPGLELKEDLGSVYVKASESSNINESNYLEKLREKDLEMSRMENKYRLCLAKAREIIRQLDMNQSRFTNYGDNVDWPREMEALQKKLHEKESYIEKLERQYENTKRQHELEDKLVTSSWYNLSMQLIKQSTVRPNQPESANDINSASTTFINRQRDTYLYKKI